MTSVTNLISVPNLPRNGCFDFEGGQNYDSLSFNPGMASDQAYLDSLSNLVCLAQRLTRKGSSGAYQGNWRWLKKNPILKRLSYFAGIWITISSASLQILLVRIIVKYPFLLQHKYLENWLTHVPIVICWRQISLRVVYEPNPIFFVQIDLKDAENLLFLLLMSLPWANRLTKSGLNNDEFSAVNGRVLIDHVLCSHELTHSAATM